MKKRILRLLLALCLVVGMMPTSVLPASAAVGDSFTEGGLTYTVLTEGDTNTVSVTGSPGLSGDVIIPETVGNNSTIYTVASIGDRAFFGCNALTSITIPNSVTSIGEGAFTNCDALTYVTIPSGVTSIGSAAFEDCDSLGTVTFGEGSQLSSIGDSAFTLCTALTSVTIPSSVASIGNNAFASCSRLTTVTFDENSQLSSIGNAAFAFTALTSVTIPSDVTSIGDGAFWNCTALTSVTIPSSVTSISHNAFNSCSALTSVTIPSSVTSIGNAAFYGCTELSSVTIPSSVTSIGINAFYGCTELSSVTIPSSVTSIGNGAFSHCDDLTSITLSCDFNTDLSSTGIYIDSNDSSKFGVTSGNTTTGTITITHTWATNLTKDETGHWYACSGCTEKKAFAQHSGTEWKSDKDNHWHECSCGDIADTTAHTPKVVNAKEATATEKGYTGDTVCEICGYEIAKGEEIPVKATPAGTNEGESADDNPASPSTGDNSNIFLWMAMLFVSGLGIVSATVLVKKRKADR